MTVRFIRCSESGSFYVIFTYRLKSYKSHCQTFRQAISTNSVMYPLFNLIKLLIEIVALSPIYDFLDDLAEKLCDTRVKQRFIETLRRVSFLRTLT